MHGRAAERRAREENTPLRGDRVNQEDKLSRQRSLRTERKAPGREGSQAPSTAAPAACHPGQCPHSPAKQEPCPPGLPSAHPCRLLTTKLLPTPKPKGLLSTEEHPSSLRPPRHGLARGREHVMYTRAVMCSSPAHEGHRCLCVKENSQQHGPGRTDMWKEEAGLGPVPVCSAASGGTLEQKEPRLGSGSTTRGC